MTSRRGIDRRRFLLGAAAGIALPTGFWRHAVADSVVVGAGPYGALATQPDANGVRLPEGFRSRIVAVGGQPMPNGYVWHDASDGAGVFAADDGGWVLVSNSEVGGGGGGVSAIVFGPPGGDGVAPVVDAYRILEGTSRNCAGGVTPWGTWLSCEEVRPSGRVWECDPFARTTAAPLDRLGSFEHEAAAVDPVSGQIYLTEDHRDGRLFRFTPDASPAQPGQRPSTTGGVLAVAAVGESGTDREGALHWVPVDPQDTATHRPPGTRSFDRCEGAWYHDGHVYVTTTTASEIYDIDVAGQRIDLLHDGSGGLLSGADNITVHATSGDLYVGEDGGNMEIVVIAGDGDARTMSPFLQVVGHDGSELTGPVFDPTGERLYVASQRGGATGDGVIFEISGPFRGRSTPPANTSTTSSTTSSTTTPPVPTSTSAGASSTAAPTTAAPSTTEARPSTTAAPSTAAPATASSTTAAATEQAAAAASSTPTRPRTSAPVVTRVTGQRAAADSRDDRGPGAAIAAAAVGATALAAGRAAFARRDRSD